MNIRGAILLLAAALGATSVWGESRPGIPRPVSRPFLDAQIPLNAVSMYVHETGAARPLFTHQPGLPMNPASTMKLLTTYAGLELLGPEHRWKTEVWADGPIEGETLRGNLVLRGYGDPKITIESFQALVAELRDAGIRNITGDLVLDRAYFAGASHDPGRFDNEPLRPYNVGPDALLTNFKAVRFVLAPAGDGRSVEIRAEPALPGLTLVNELKPAAGDCGDWRTHAQASFTSETSRATATFRGRYAIQCGERNWYVSLFSHAHYLHGMFVQYWREAGGSFSGNVRDGPVPAQARRLVVHDSAPLYDVIRDINKFSNNVMARHLFLSLASGRRAPPLDTAKANEVVREWLSGKKLSFTELVLENGSGLSRIERISAQNMGRLLQAAHSGKNVGEFVASLAVAAVDGTMQRRLNERPAAGHAWLKTGSLEGVRTLAGYLTDGEGRRWILVCFVNHRNAANAQGPLDNFVQWVFDHAGHWPPGVRASAR